MAATASHELTQFSWGEISFSQTTYVDGVPHPTRKAIGELLEYPDPQKAIDKILERNSHIELHSVPVRLTGTDGKFYETKVYHPIGFLMIMMESDQPKAKKMKAVVADFVWNFAGPKTMSFKETMEYIKPRRALVQDLVKIGDPAARAVLIEDLCYVSRLLGRPVPEIARLHQLPLPR
jgi:hypothetical protein